MTETVELTRAPLRLSTLRKESDVPRVATDETHPGPTDEEHRVRAIWNGKVIAESDDTVVVEGNHYFPRESVDDSVLVDSTTQTTCPWKGQASYFSLIVDGHTNRDAAWYYPTPKSAAAQIRHRVAFWRGVTVTG